MRPVVQAHHHSRESTLQCAIELEHFTLPRSGLIRKMSHDFFDPTPEEQVIVLVEHEAIRNAEGFVKSCEHCNPEGAEWAFNVLLDRITGSNPRMTHYVLEAPA